RFGEIGFPNERTEDWKFTNLAPIVRTSFALPEVPPAPPTRRLPETDSGDTAFGFVGTEPALVRGSLPSGVRLMSLAEALPPCQDLANPHSAPHAASPTPASVAPTPAFWRDGLFLHVPPGVVVERPILIRYVQSAPDGGPPLLWYRRCLCVLERGSQATLVER